MKIYSKKIQEYRKRKSLTQEDFASLMKVSRQLVSKWETGDSIPNSDDLKTLSIILDVPMNKLLNNVEENKKLSPQKKKKIIMISSIIGGAWLLSMIIIISIVIISINTFTIFDYRFEYSVLQDDNNQSYISIDKVNYTKNGTVEIPKSYKGYTVKEIGYASFENVSKKLTNVKLPDTILTIDDYAFEDCCELESITLSNNLVKIGSMAFSSCNKLREIDLPNSITKIGYGAFKECNNLTNITLPETLKTLGASAFSKCESLTKINFPQSLELIPAYVISGSGVENIILPENEIEIESYALSGSKIKEFTCPDWLTIIPDGLFSYSEISSITFSNGFKKIGANAFSNCVNLTKVSFPASLTTLSEYAFEYTGITSLDLSSCKVTTIPENCFAYCQNLKQVYLNYGTNYKIEYYAFRNCEKLNVVLGLNGTSNVSSVAFINTPLEDK